MEENDYALNQMRTVLKADTTPSATLDLTALVGPGGQDLASAHTGGHHL
jgi:hypothetical protein